MHEQPVTAASQPGLPPGGTTLQLVRRLLVREGQDGHTVTPVRTLLAGLAGCGVSDPQAALEAATASGQVVLEPAGASLAEIAQAENAVAASVHTLLAAEPGRLSVVAGPAGPAREASATELATTWSGPVGHGVTTPRAVVRVPAADWRTGLERADRLAGRVIVVDDADQLGLREAADLLGACVDDGAALVVAGDPCALPAGGRPLAGAVLRDLSRATAPVHQVGRDLPEHPTALGQLDAAVRAGQLPPLDTDTHDLVVVPVANDAQLRTRVDQLVGVSIPRAYKLAREGIAVLTVRGFGAGGAHELSVLVGDRATALPVTHAGGRRWPAVVLVLPGGAAGSVTVPLLLSALGRADRHLSIVTGLGGQLSQLVARRHHRPRRTRLPGLLQPSPRPQGRSEPGSSSVSTGSSSS